MADILYIMNCLVDLYVLYTLHNQRNNRVTNRWKRANNKEALVKLKNMIDVYCWCAKACYYFKLLSYAQTYSVDFRSVIPRLVLVLVAARMK